jgi:hypothetical protein
MYSSRMHVTDDSARQEHGWRAIHARLEQSLVFIVDGPLGEDKYERDHGSGTLIRTPGGNVVVLTAAHVVDQIPTDGCTLGGYGIDPVAAPFEALWTHPNRDVDAGLALVRPDLANRCRALAMPLESIGDSAFELAQPQSDPTTVCGYPKARRVQRLDHRNKVKFQGYVSVAYTTSVTGLDEKGRYRVAWSEAVADKDHDGLLDAYGLKVGEVFDQCHPGGISGGPLWVIRGLKKGELWSAERAALLIGVCESWDKQDVEFCPSSRLWADWLRERIAAIDSGET